MRSKTINAIKAAIDRNISVNTSNGVVVLGGTAANWTEANKAAIDDLESFLARDPSDPSAGPMALLAERDKWRADSPM